MSKLHVSTSKIKPQNDDHVVTRMLGSSSLKELQRFSNSVLQFHQFLELFGSHPITSCVARPLADIVHNSIEDALALHLRLQEDRGLLDDAIERLLNTRLVKSREREVLSDTHFKIFSEPQILSRVVEITPLRRVQYRRWSISGNYVDSTQLLLQLLRSMHVFESQRLRQVAYSPWQDL